MSKRSYERRIQAKRDAAKAARKRAERIRKIRMWVSAGVAVVLALVLFLVFRPSGVSPTASPTDSPTAVPSMVATPCPGPTPPAPKSLSYPKAPASSIDSNKVYVATFETSCGTFKIQMDPKVAPKTVNNFVFLARAGYYDGTKFHRVQNETDFAIVQGGDPEGTGRGGPGYSYDGETPAPSAKYLRGTIAMANSGGPSSNGSQFFIVVKDWAGLPTNYTIFGQVIDEANSFIALDKMITTEGTPIEGGLGTTPVPPIFITKVTIEELARS
ncbi:MAG TPA: peptidylprolyl isomerase [Actinomycetota bacterium]|nr:peptidylprolyl isomerase [Actinomycetota bacterium]